MLPSQVKKSLRSRVANVLAAATLTLTGVALLSLPATAQTILDVNFDSRRAGTYTESQVEQDFGDIRFTNGVDQGWVQVVRGSQAFGGSGASLRVFYPAGGEGPRGGGAQWISEFDGLELEEAYLTYRVKFGAGFDFVRGGKLPGMAGGSAPSGSAPADGVRGWTGRLMWRTAFTGETGQPEQTTSGIISYAKHLHSGFAMDGRQEDEEFLNEADGSQTTLLPNVWYEIRQRIVLNTPGRRDGIQQLWIDGRLGLDRRDYQWRNTSDLKIDRFFFSTFFGGGFDWRSSKGEFVFFDDIKMSGPQERRVPEDFPSPNAAVAAANPGDTILLGSANWYGNLSINQPLTIRGRGNARLMAANGSLPIIRVNSDAVNIESLRFSRGVAGVDAFSQASRLRIVDCDFRNNFGDAIRATNSRDVSIINTDVISNEGRGIFLNGVDEFLIFNSISSRNGGAGFELFSDNGFVAESTATDNRAGAGFFFIGSNTGFSNNVSEDNQGMGFLLVSSDSCGVEDNRATGNTSFGFLGYDVTNSFIARNLIEDNQAVGLILDNSRDCAVVSNSINNNDGIGAYFSPTTRRNYSADNQYQGNAFSLGLIDEGNNTVDP